MDVYFIGASGVKPRIFARFGRSSLDGLRSMNDNSSLDELRSNDLGGKSQGSIGTTSVSAVHPYLKDEPKVVEDHSPPIFPNTVTSDHWEAGLILNAGP